jgi:hypothetical protein
MTFSIKIFRITTLSLKNAALSKTLKNTTTSIKNLHTQHDNKIMALITLPEAVFLVVCDPSMNQL